MPHSTKTQRKKNKKNLLWGGSIFTTKNYNLNHQNYNKNKNKKCVFLNRRAIIK